MNHLSDTRIADSNAVREEWETRRPRRYALGAPFRS